MKRLLPLLILAASPARAAETDLAMIDRAVANLTGAMIGEPGGAAHPVDRRLHLARCEAPLAIAWYGSGRDTVIVRCPDPGSWRIFVPLAQSAPAAASQPAVLRGEAVTIAVEGEGFSVAQPGEALDPGPVGAWIRVRGATANAQPFRARVVRPGLVAVEIGNSLP